jgi:hypothetical protein
LKVLRSLSRTAIPLFVKLLARVFVGTNRPRMNGKIENELLLKEIVASMNFKFDDARMPTEQERQQLARLMYLAFCDLRILAREARTEQAKSLADAFHNVPLLMHGNNFSFRAFRDSLCCYQNRYPSKLVTNYLEELDKLTAAKNSP